MHKKNLLSTAFGALCLFTTVGAQISADDYRKADSVMNLNKLVYHQLTASEWIDSSSVFWYQVKTREGVQVRLVDAVKGTNREAFSIPGIVEQINKKADKKTSAGSVQFRGLKFNLKANSISFEYDGVFWTCRLKDYSLTKDSLVRQAAQEPYWGEPFDELGNKPVWSPDSSRTAFIREFNVYVKEAKTGRETRLSYDGTSEDFYSSYFSWSPDSKKLAVNRVRNNELHPLYFVESSPSTQLQPILHKRNYLKAGDLLPVKHPSLFDIVSMKQIPVNTKDFENQFDLSFPKWNESSTAFSFDFNQRGHQVYQVAEVDASTGAVRLIIDERSKTFIDYSSKIFRYDLEKRGEIIWASERDGWNHLYLYDVKTGRVKNQITRGDWVMRGVVKVDEKNAVIFFKASGLYPDEDPYFIHYCRVNFDGTGFLDLTPEKQDHDADFSFKSDYFIDTRSTVNTPPVSVLRRSSDGKVILELEKADISDLLAAGWIAPEPFTAKGRDGATDIWGNIYRPTGFDPERSYPVIEYIYAGPHDSFVQKGFRPASWSISGLAELGFIIVQIDGMGTSNRSKAFHDVCWKNLKDAGFPDRILWIKAAAEKYSYMDTARVGIYGTSAGGQSSMAGMLWFPDFYKACVSSCGCHDNRMDKMWWNEQWMGWPVGPEYAENSNLVNASRLKGKLMLIVGEMDDNVDPSSTLQVANALIRAKKDFELVVIPGSNHTSGGEYGERKRRDFFVRTLLNESVPDWNELK